MRPQGGDHSGIDIETVAELDAVEQSSSSQLLSHRRVPIIDVYPWDGDADSSRDSIVLGNLDKDRDRELHAAEMDVVD